MSEKRFIFELLQNNYYQIIKKDDDYFRRLSPKEVVDCLNEQQATIRKLQDLCGESDSENAKLRIENKRLQEENEQLRKELKELENNYKDLLYDGGFDE